jgi:hypothetical protein
MVEGFFHEFSTQMPECDFVTRRGQMHKLHVLGDVERRIVHPDRWRLPEEPRTSHLPQFGN